VTGDCDDGTDQRLGSQFCPLPHLPHSCCMCDSFVFYRVQDRVGAAPAAVGPASIGLVSTVTNAFLATFRQTVLSARLVEKGSATTASLGLVYACATKGGRLVHPAHVPSVRPGTMAYRVVCVCALCTVCVTMI
jgi:hypothetical protein